MRGPSAIMTDMQPHNVEQSVNPELPSVQPPVSGETIPALPTPETGLDTGAERVEQVSELRAMVSDAATALPVTPITPPVDNTDDTSTTLATGTPVNPVTPMVAEDSDLIEKVWVDKAKDVVKATKDDPYRRSNEVSALQRDYQKKRFNRDLGTAA